MSNHQSEDSMQGGWWSGHKVVDPSELESRFSMEDGLGFLDVGTEVPELRCGEPGSEPRHQAGARAGAQTGAQAGDKRGDLHRAESSVASAATQSSAGRLASLDTSAWLRHPFSASSG